jgi:hypothetical protein
MMAHTSGPHYSGGEYLEDQGLRTALAKGLQDPISTFKKPGMVAHTCHPSYRGIFKKGP